MNELKELRDLVGDYYSSYEDEKSAIAQKLSQGILFPVNGFVPVKNIKGKILNMFYSMVNYPQKIHQDQFLARYLINKYNDNIWQYLFYEGDQVEITWFNKDKSVKASIVTDLNFTQTKLYGKTIPENLDQSQWLSIKLIKRNFANTDYNQKALELHKSINYQIAAFLDSLLMGDRISLGKSTKKVDKLNNAKTFLKNLKIQLPDQVDSTQMKKIIQESSINWGIKDLVDLKTLSLIVNTGDFWQEVLLGKTNLKHLFVKINNHKKKLTEHEKECIMKIEEFSL